MTDQRPAELELKILSVLWEHGPLTVRDVREHLADDKPRAYTTILSTMQVMEKKKLLGHQREGTAHVFHPLVERTSVMKPLMDNLLNTVFGGKPSAMLQCLLDEETVDDAELKEIRRLIREQSQRSKEGGAR